MRRRTNLVIHLLVLTAAFARTSAAQPLLSVDDAVREALAHNRVLTAARSSVAEATAGVVESRAARLPRITLSEAWQRGNQPVFVFSSLLASRRFAASDFAVDALNHPDPLGFFRTSVGVDHVVFDGGRARAQVRAATLRHDLAETAADETAVGVTVKVTQTFGRLLLATAARRAAESMLAAAQDDLARVRHRRDAGTATEADVLSFAVHVSDVQQRVIQSSGDAAEARAALNRLMGSPIERDYLPAEPVVDDATEVPAFTTLLVEAERQRPEMRRAALEARLSENLVQQARTALVPQVAAQAAVDIAGTSVADRASSWALGGELRWTLSTGGAERARLKAAAEARTRARIEAEDVRSMVHVDIVTALSRLAAARARQAVGRAATEQARESQRIIRNRFEAGLASVTDALRAASAVLDADARQTAALVDALVAAAELDRAVGKAVRWRD